MKRACKAQGNGLVLSKSGKGSAHIHPGKGLTHIHPGKVSGFVDILRVK